MKNLRAMWWISLAFALLLGACDVEPSADQPDDVGADIGEDSQLDAAEVGADTPPDAPEADTAAPDVAPDVAPDAMPDAAPDAPEEVEPDVDEGPCPGSILCFDEISGNPSARVCLEAGFPEGTVCVRQGEEIACCVAPFFCESDDDCEGARDEQDFCPDPRYPCVCDIDSGVCDVGICSTGSECADSEVCLDGICVDDPGADGFVAMILSAPGFVTPGATTTLFAIAVDVEDTSRTHPDLPIVWTVDEGEGGTIDPAGVLTGAATAGPVTVRARVADNDADPGDTVTYTNLGDAPSEGLRVTLFDDNTRAPVMGALVVSGDESAESDETGTAVLSGDPPFDVHVFADGYAYLSAVGAESRALLLPVPPNQRARVTEIRDGFVCEASDEDFSVHQDETDCGGPGEVWCLCYEHEGVDVARGLPSFAVVPPLGDLSVSISGFSLGNALLDVNLDLIVGPNIERIFPEGSPLPLDEQVEIPSGITIDFNNQPLIDNFVATAGAGPRSVWSIGGIVPLNTVLLDILPSLSGDLDIGVLIAAILPFFDDFYSGVTPPVDLVAEGTFPVRDPEVVLNVPTQRKLHVTVPALPELPVGWTDTAIVLGGAYVPGQGFVPLGITGGADDPDRASADGRVDGDTGTPEIEPLRISMAPVHGGIHGPDVRYMFASVALQIGGAPGAPREAASGIITRLEPGAALSGTIETGRDAFPPLALDSAWGGADGDRVFTIDSVGEFDFYRIVFRNRRGHMWVVYAPAGTTAVTMPAPTDDIAFEDRTSRGRVNIVGVRLDADAGLDYQSLVSANAATFSEMFPAIAAFSTVGL